MLIQNSMAMIDTDELDTSDLGSHDVGKMVNYVLSFFKEKLQEKKIRAVVVD